MPSHGLTRQTDADAFVGEPANPPPGGRMAEFGFNLAGGAVHADRRLEEHDHERRVMPRPSPDMSWRARDDGGELMDFGVGENGVETFEGADTTPAFRHPMKPSP